MRGKSNSPLDTVMVIIHIEHVTLKGLCNVTLEVNLMSEETCLGCSYCSLI